MNRNMQRAVSTLYKKQGSTIGVWHLSESTVSSHQPSPSPSDTIPSAYRRLGRMSLAQSSKSITTSTVGSLDRLIPQVSQLTM